MGWKVGEVEPCPFCGYIGEFSPRPYGVVGAAHLSAMYCGSCNAQGPPAGTREEALRLWNHQRIKMGVKLDDAWKEIHRLRKVIEEYARTGTYKRPLDPMELIDRP